MREKISRFNYSEYVYTHEAAWDGILHKPQAALLAAWSTWSMMHQMYIRTDIIENSAVGMEMMQKKLSYVLYN